MKERRKRRETWILPRKKKFSIQPELERHITNEDKQRHIKHVCETVRSPEWIEKLFNLIREGNSL